MTKQRNQGRKNDDSVTLWSNNSTKICTDSWASFSSCETVSLYTEHIVVYQKCSDVKIGSDCFVIWLPCYWKRYMSSSYHVTNHPPTKPLLLSCI